MIVMSDQEHLFPKFSNSICIIIKRVYGSTRDAQKGFYHTKS